MSELARRVICLAAVVSTLVPTAVTADTSAERSIIIFRNQHAELAPRGPTASIRSSLIDGEQSTVASALTRTRARDVKRFHLINAMAATLSSDEAAELRARPDVLAVVPDLPLLPRSRASPPPAVAGSPTPAVTGPQALCPPDPSVPLLEPEALSLMNVPLQAVGQPPVVIDGTGVKVAFMADGLDVNNPDFIRSDGSHVFFDYVDFSTEGPSAPTDGTEAFGEASSIGAQARVTYDLSVLVNPAHPLPPGCNVQVRGVSPGASLAGLKVFGMDTQSFASYLIQAIEYAVTVDHVDVIDQAIVDRPFPDPVTDPIALTAGPPPPGSRSTARESGGARGPESIPRPHA